MIGLDDTFRAVYNLERPFRRHQPKISPKNPLLSYAQRIKENEKENKNRKELDSSTTSELFTFQLRYKRSVDTG